MITFSVVILVSFPSPAVTDIVFLSTNEPTPFSTSILFFFIRKAMPSTLDFTTSSLRFIIWLILIFGAGISIPCSLKCSLALMKCSDESSNALEGIQPTFRQVPPRVLYFSIIAVLKPSCAQRIAATYPPGPEPITVTLYCMIMRNEI